jgi:NAD-dependent SIR2 family protein deacetylase
VDHLAGIIASGGVFVLTGAGLSTDSGIPDYRGRDGIRRVTPMPYAEFTGSSPARRRYWARSFVGWRRFGQARPNGGHDRVADLQRLGLTTAIVTQNVDGLHQGAGAREVIELHGSLAQVVGRTCGDRSDRAALQDRMAQANPGFEANVAGVAADGSRVSSQIRPDGDVVLTDQVVERFRQPTCLVCAGDVLKPDVVFFGESVPRDRVARCFDLVAASRSMLVLGSSLAVMSGYRFVRAAHARGIPVAILTLGATRGDTLAAVKVDASLGPSLDVLVAALR